MEIILDNGGPMLIYLAGPYGDGQPNAKKHVQKAIKAARKVISKGYVPYVPHLTHYVAEGWKANPGRPTWLAVHIVILLRCDAVLMLDGWEESEGARLEKALAERFGIPVYESLEGIDELET